MRIKPFKIDSLATIFLASLIVVSVQSINYLNWGTCLDDGGFRNIYAIAIDQCINECAARTGCRSVSYHRRTCMCVMHVWDSIATSKRGCAGYVFSEKRQWQNFQRIGDSPCNVLPCESGKKCEEGICHIKECEAPPVVDAAVRFGNRVAVGSKVKYVCDNGVLNEHVQFVSTCLDTGQWEPFVCPKCGDPPLISDAVVSPGTTRLGTTRTYECTEGYKSTPKSDDVAVITCQTSGQWSVPNLQCDPEVITFAGNCSSDSDCLESNSRCFQGTCFCQPLFSYSQDKRTCVQVCSSLSSASWDTYELYIKGHNVRSAIVTSVAACQDHCISIGPECGSFDYSANANPNKSNCYCNGATFSQVKETVPQNLISSQTWRLYSRQCVAL